MDLRQFTMLLRDPTSAMYHLLTLWSEVPMLLMRDVDWKRGPLVLVGKSDRMMWPLLPPGSLLQLDPQNRTVVDGQWGEFERPIYLVEYRNRFLCCHLQRRGETLRMIPHNESPERSSISVPYRDAKIRGQVKPIFRPLATRGNLAGRPERLKRPHTDGGR